MQGLGFDLDDDQVVSFFEAFKELADRKKIYDGDLIALYESVVRGRHQAVVDDPLQVPLARHPWPRRRSPSRR